MLDDDRHGLRILAIPGNLRFARRVGAALALLAAGCGGGGGDTPGTADLGVPDPDHGAIVDGDIDGDGVPDASDNCPSLANRDQRPLCDYPFPPPEPTGAVVADALARLNFWRDLVGLAPVVEDPALSRGCQVHLDYLQMYAADHGQPYHLAHEEDASLPYASAEGNQAGVDSVLSYGQSDVMGAVDGWIDTLYHRLPLFHPGLTRVGVAFESRYACILYRQGTDAGARASHPILWPLADTLYTSPQFGGAESPCPTAEDPLGGGDCPPSAAIATVGLHGRALSAVSGRIARVDTGEEVPLFRTYYEGGPSPHEQMGYLDGHVALVPEPMSTLVATEYEARVDATVDGTPQTFRWRYRVGGGVRQDAMCDVFRRMNFDFARAIDVTAASIQARICGEPMFYRLRDTGNYRVSLEYDPRFGALELHVYDASQVELGVASGGDGNLRVENVPGRGYIEVRGHDGAVGGYRLLIEQL